MTSIILLCGGKGTRLGQAKAQALLMGKTLLQWNLELLKSLPFKHEVIIVEKGGKTRHESVKIGLKKAKGEIVIIHNVANPLAQVEDFLRVHKELLKHDCACFVGQKIVDTVRQLKGVKSTTIPRNDLWRAQTPQGFRRKTLCEHLKKPTPPLHLSAVAEGGWGVTDEISLFENSTIPIRAFETSDWNIKITTPKDIEFLEEHLEEHLRGEVRVGIGEDAHSFDTKGTLTLAGVKVKGFPKLKANSDGDVILHALCNALLSAMGQGSFSEIADPMCKKGIFDSTKYVKKIIHTPPYKGAWGSWNVHNLAISLTCTEPKIDPLVPKMKKNLSKLLDIEEERIGITATTGDSMMKGAPSERAGISCMTILSLIQK